MCLAHTFLKSFFFFESKRNLWDFAYSTTPIQFFFSFQHMKHYISGFIQLITTSIMFAGYIQSSALWSKLLARVLWSFLYFQYVMPHNTDILLLFLSNACYHKFPVPILYVFLQSLQIHFHQAPIIGYRLILGSWRKRYFQQRNKSNVCCKDLFSARHQVIFTSVLCMFKTYN